MSTSHGTRRAVVLASLGVFSLCLATTSLTARAEEGSWVSVAKSDRTELFARPTSLKWAGAWLSVRTRQEFVEPQPSAKQGKTFLSARNEYRIDCGQRRLAYQEMQAYAQANLQGEVVQKTKIGDKNLKWMDAPADTVFGELLDYACSNAPAAPAADTK
jgi:hypothetical protein